MLDTIFLRVLTMSAAASLAIALVLPARLLLRAAPRVYSYALWSVVLFRLLCPFSFESAASLFPKSAEPLTPAILLAAEPQIKTGFAVIDGAVNASLPAPAPLASMNPLQFWAFLGEAVWLCGVAILLGWSLLSLFRLKKRLRGAVRVEGNLYSCEALVTPFVLGVFSPRIYLPAALPEQERACILLHEQTHIRRGDPVWKLLGFFALCVHWFNPFVWLAFRLAVQDMEMSCDEAVVQKLGVGVKKTYSASLLAFASGRRFPGGEPLAFGEGDPKARIRNVLRFQAPMRRAVVFAAPLVLALCACLAANPKSEAAPVSEPPSAVPAQTYSAISFPAYQGGRDSFNQAFYDTPPFALIAELPEGWTTAIPPEAEQAFSTPATPVSFYDAEGAYCGYVGFGLIQDYEGEIPQEDYYKAVYPELRLSSICIWDDYTPVQTTETSETALATIYYAMPVEGQSAAGWPQDTTLGILHYDKSLGVWVALYFEKDAITAQQQRQIADSIRLEAAPV